MVKNIEQKLDVLSAELKEPVVFVLSLCMRMNLSEILLENGILKLMNNRSASSFSSFSFTRRQRILPRFLIIGSVENPVVLATESLYQIF